MASEHRSVETDPASTSASRTSTLSHSTKKSIGSNARMEKEYGGRSSWS
jgi:hypothetical protein